MRTPLFPVLRASASPSTSSSATLTSTFQTAVMAARRCQRHPCVSTRTAAPLLLSCSFSQSSTHRKSRQPPQSVAGLLNWKPAEPVLDVVIHGFVRSVRSMKANSFVTLGDGSSLAPLQAVVPASLADGLANGAAVRLKGSWVPSPGAGQSHELHVQAVEIIGPSDAKTFPIQKKYQSPEYLRTLPHLRSRLPFHSTLLRLRSDVISSINGFFTGRDFIQTHPPIITSSDCEGAGEVFTVAPANTEASPSLSSSSSSSPLPPFFRAPKYLTVSTQLHLEALAQSVGSVWTLSPTFRAEESDTPRHLSEFYMLEVEACFVDQLDGVMDLAEDLLRAVTTDLQSSRVAAELLERPSIKKGGGSFSRADSGSPLPPPEDVARRWQGLVHPDRWPRITYSEAIRMLAAAPVDFEYAPVWGNDLHTEHEKYLAQAVGGSNHTPVFVTHYPRDMKAFYMLPSEHLNESVASATVDCFDLLVPEFCEIAGGSMREHRLPQLVAAMQARGMDVSAEPVSPDSDPRHAKIGGDLDWYVDLRRWGCPPHGGFGIGFDRLLCYLSGVQTIRDTVAFPRWFGRCDC